MDPKRMSDLKWHELTIECARAPGLAGDLLDRTYEEALRARASEARLERENEALRGVAKMARSELDRWGHDRDCARLRSRLNGRRFDSPCDCNIAEALPAIDAALRTAATEDGGCICPPEHHHLRGLTDRNCPVHGNRAATEDGT